MKDISASPKSPWYGIYVRKLSVSKECGINVLELYPYSEGNDIDHVIQCLYHDYLRLIIYEGIQLKGWFQRQLNLRTPLEGAA